MGAWEIGELVGFVAVGSGLLVLLELGLRRAGRQRAARAGRSSVRPR